jgi:hypothetical protein
MAADNVLGSVQIFITGDSSKLQSDFANAQKLAQAAGSQISSALTASLAPGMRQASALVDQFGRAFQTAGDEAKKAKPPIDDFSAAGKGLADALIGIAGAEDIAASGAERLANAHGHAVTEIQATSGAIRVFENSGGIRAAERFIATTLGIGPALQAIFPIVGAIALTEQLAKVGEEVYKVAQNFFFMRDAEEATQAVGLELAKSAETAIEHITQLQVEALRDRGKLVQAAKTEMEGLLNKPIQLPNLNEGDNKKKLSGLSSDELPNINKVYSEVLPSEIPKRIQDINDGIARTSKELKQIQDSGFDPTFLDTHYANQDKVALELYGNALQFLQIKQQEFAAETGKASADIGKAQTDEQKKREEVARAASELLKRQAAEQKQSDELELAQMKSQHAVSVGDLIKFWRDKLAIEGDGAQRSREIQITLGNLYQEQDKVIQKIQERGIKIQEEQAKRAEKQQAFLSEMAVEGEVLAIKIGADIVKINAQIAVAQARTGSQEKENVLAQQRLQIEREYGLLIAKTAQSQIDYAKQLAASDKAEMDEKINLLETERRLSITEKERGDIDDKLVKARGQAAQKEIADQTKIDILIQQSSALGRIQIGIWNAFTQVWGQLSQGIASAIVGAQKFGQVFKSIAQSIGSEILRTIIGVALKPLEDHLSVIVAKWLGLKAITSAAAKAQIAEDAAVIAAKTAGIASATSAQIGANTLILNDTIGTYAAIAAVASATDVDEVAGDAAVGGAAAFASTAAIPIIGPALAPAAGAAAYAAILGTYGPLAAFEKGGLVPETMMALVHKGEWVTPAAQVAQGITGPRSGGGGGNTYVTINSYSIAETARAMAKYMKSAGGMRFSPASSS